jgi:hypothetical protein
MAANPTYNDGALEYGSAVLTITPSGGGTGFDCIADSDFSFDENSKRVLQTNQYGEPLKKFGVPELREGSCTVQLPAAKRIRRGDSFTAAGIATGDTSRVWIVENASHVYAKEDYAKQTIKYSEKLN